MANARMRRSAGDPVSRLTLLQAIATANRALASGAVGEAGIDALLKTIGEQTGHQHAYLVELATDPETKEAIGLCPYAWGRGYDPRSIKEAFPIRIAQFPPSLIEASQRGETVMLDTGVDAPERLAHIQSLNSPMGLRPAHILAVPLLLGDGTLWGWLCLDSSEAASPYDEIDAAALDSVAGTMSALIQRDLAEDRRQIAEQERLAQAHQATADLQRRSDLLEAVVAASDVLLAATSLEQGAESVLRTLGLALGVDRVLLGRFDPADALSEVGWLEFIHEWTSPETPRQLDVPELRRFDMALYGEFARPLLAGQPVAVVTDDIADAVARAEQESTGAFSQFQYPIMVDGALWGTIGADDCTRPRRFNDAEIATLKLVSSALGSLVKRERLTGERIAAEQLRAETIERSAKLLGSVARASEALLRAGSYRNGIEEALSALGESVDSGRVYVIENDVEAATGEPIGLCRNQWASEDLSNTANDARYYPFSLNQIPPDGLAALRAGRAYVYLTEEHADALRVRSFARAGLPHTAIGTPIITDGHWWGTLWFDLHGADARVSLSDEPALRAAASAIASALARDTATAARSLAERELAEEKSRMAREIHDTLAQGFTGVIMQLHATEDALDADDGVEARRHTVRAINRARMGLSEARRSVYALRPPLLDDGDLVGALRLAMSRIVDGLPLSASLVVHGEVEPLSEPVAIELFRISQEALSNTIRHASATNVTLVVDFCSAQHVELSLIDNGAGFDVNGCPKPHGFGLVSMRERAERIGATLSITSSNRDGTIVRVTAPRSLTAMPAVSASMKGLLT